MHKRKLQSKWQALVDVRFDPAVAPLPASVPAERRDEADYHALMCRICSEFEEMPGLSVTVVQAARLFGLAPDVASRILHGLAEAGVLRAKRNGRFVLREEV
jgi:hypothetical protein